MSLAPLADKFVLVTGASGVIGSAVAERLAADGAVVLAHYDSSEEGARATVERIRAAGGRAEAIRSDLSRRDCATRTFAAADAAFGGAFAGRLDVLVNNAGIFAYGTLALATDDDFDCIFDVNVRALFALSREAARRMTEAGAGRIVNVGSVFGEATPVPGMGLYAASKFAVRGFTRAWSRELGPLGITVNAVEPALIQAEPFPTDGPSFDALQRFNSVGTFGRGADVAEAVAFLAGTRSGYVNGVTIPVDGGWSA